MSRQFAELLLPITVATRADVNRLFREAELLDDFILQDKTRMPGVQPRMPQTSRNMDEFCKQNEFNLLVDEHRAKVLAFLKYLKKSAPVIHISFAVEASPTFMQKIMQWVRQNIDSHALVLVGLAPSIVAGCIVRTTNKVFNFGLRQRFDAHKSVLVEQIRTLG